MLYTCTQTCLLAVNTLVTYIIAKDACLEGNGEKRNPHAKLVLLDSNDPLKAAAAVVGENPVCLSLPLSGETCFCSQLFPLFVIT